jgi:hypothetical protein
MSSVRDMLPLLAVAAVIVLLHQGLDVFTHAAGADLGSASGRGGLVAALWSRAPALISADVFLVAAAQHLSWKPALRALSLLHILAGAAALAVLPVFLSDAGGIASQVTVAELTPFRISVARMLIGFLALGIGSVVVGLGLAARLPTSGGERQAA